MTFLISLGVAYYTFSYGRILHYQGKKSGAWSYYILAFLPVIGYLIRWFFPS